MHTYFKWKRRMLSVSSFMALVCVCHFVFTYRFVETNLCMWITYYYEISGIKECWRKNWGGGAVKSKWVADNLSSLKGWKMVSYFGVCCWHFSSDRCSESTDVNTCQVLVKYELEYYCCFTGKLKNKIRAKINVRKHN